MSALSTTLRLRSWSLFISLRHQPPETVEVVEKTSLGVFLRLLQDADEIHRYRLLVRSFCVMTVRQANPQQALNEHIAILDALATGRPAAACKAMADHMTPRLKEVLSRMTVPRFT
jgi:DNA-binding GntR family transcriptional regulator